MGTSSSDRPQNSALCAIRQLQPPGSRHMASISAAAPCLWKSAVRIPGSFLCLSGSREEDTGAVTLQNAGGCCQNSSVMLSGQALL